MPAMKGDKENACIAFGSSAPIETPSIPQRKKDMLADAPRKYRLPIKADHRLEMGSQVIVLEEMDNLIRFPKRHVVGHDP